MAIDGSPLYPVFLDLRGRLVVAVGSSPALARRAVSLAGQGGDVVVITPEPLPELLDAESRGLLTVEQRNYVRGDLEGAFLVVVASGDAEIDAAVAAEADERGTPVNVAGRPELCSFLVPSTVRRGDLRIALSTGGRSPQLARHARAAIEERFGPEWSAFSLVVGELRELVLTEAPEREAEVLAAALAPEILERFADPATAPDAATLLAELMPTTDGEGEAS